ncbi:hypothetical protein [Brevundimonas sp. P7753]|uniref:hypothetical protein n=1 Tax=Brevundimonas sp. P7753 TaxID=2726982 RepID=UPI0015C0DC90|nr:hypothetical protein [Brevundimonas sp. P7753]NWE53654.1 hypothetical protein [Brevundimonas sp. P7753]
MGRRIRQQLERELDDLGPRAFDHVLDPPRHVVRPRVHEVDRGQVFLNDRIGKLIATIGTATQDAAGDQLAQHPVGGLRSGIDGAGHLGFEELHDGHVHLGERAQRDLDGGDRRLQELGTEGLDEGGLPEPGPGDEDALLQPFRREAADLDVALGLIGVPSRQFILEVALGRRRLEARFRPDDDLLDGRADPPTRDLDAEGSAERLPIGSEAPLPRLEQVRPEIVLQGATQSGRPKRAAAARRPAHQVPEVGLQGVRQRRGRTELQAPEVGGEVLMGRDAHVDEAEKREGGHAGRKRGAHRGQDPFDPLAAAGLPLGLGGGGRPIRHGPEGVRQVEGGGFQAVDHAWKIDRHLNGNGGAIDAGGQMPAGVQQFFFNGIVEVADQFVKAGHG